jgi:hypothetical protein
MNVTDNEYRVGLAYFLEGLKKAATEGLFSPDPELNISMFKRLMRTVLSQGNADFAEAFVGIDPQQLLDPVFAKKQASVMTKISDEAQRAMNYAPGVVEGHHPISVSSIEAASRHLPLEDRLEFLQVLNNEYQVGGTNGWGQFGLSKFGHQGYGTRASRPFPEMNAHFSSDPSTMVQEGFKVDTGTWQNEDFSSIKDPRKLAHEFYRRSGEPQMRFAEIAYDQPQEVAFRQALSDSLGIRPRDLDSVVARTTDKGKPISNANWVRDQIKAKGIDVDALMHQAYGIDMPIKTDTPKVRAPRGPKKDPIKPTLEALQATGMFDTDFVNGSTPIRQQTIKNGTLRAGIGIGGGIPPQMLSALGFIPAVGAVLDAGDSVAGTHQAVTGKTSGDKLAGTFQAISGAAGLASLSPIAPIAAPVSMAAAGLSAATQRRADMDKPKPPKPLYGTGRVASIVPTKPKATKPVGNGQGGVSKPKGAAPKPTEDKPIDLGNEIKWGLKQLGINL